jgi:hypothetical protein
MRYGSVEGSYNFQKKIYKENFFGRECLENVAFVVVAVIEGAPDFLVEVKA